MLLLLLCQKFIQLIIGKNPQRLVLLFGLMVTVVCHVEINKTILEVRGKWIWIVKKVVSLVEERGKWEEGKRNRGREEKKRKLKLTIVYISFFVIYKAGI